MDLLDPTWTEIPEGNKRAELYPYSAPQFNFLLNNGELQKLPNSYDLKNKIAILAIGSNRSPSQLLRKFGGNEQIPVTIVNVKDIDVVYASMISYYGAVPATLWPVKGSILKLSIIWLDNRQLKIMHETEAVGKAYDFVKFEKNKIICNSNDHLPKEVFGYVSKFGALNFGFKTRDVRALSAINAKKRKIKAINQKSALLFLKEKINYKNNYNTKKDFLNRIISEKNYRLNTNKKLNSLGILPNENKWEVIKNIKSDTLKFY